VFPDKGINRIYWDLREESVPTDVPGGMMGGMGGGMPGGAAVQMPAGMRGGGRGGFGGGGPWVLPGEYKVVLDLNGQKYEQKFEVKPDAKHNITLEERKLNQKFSREAAALVQKGNQYMAAINAIVAQLDQIEKDVRAQKVEPSVLDAVKALKQKALPLQEAFAPSKPGQTQYRQPYFIALRGGTLPEQLRRVMSSASGYQGAPTQTVIDQFKDIEALLNPLLQKLEALVKTDVPALNKMLNEKGLAYIKLN
jgi:hypothetical protein